MPAPSWPEQRYSGKQTLAITLTRFPTLPSTQDWLRQQAQQGAAEILAVQAVEQTAGRGRLDRSWWSPADAGLYLSLLLRPLIPIAQAPRLTMLVSLAAIEACQTVAGVTSRPKWPNDLLLEGRKLAGILTEIEQEAGQLQYAIIGLGLNVNMNFAGGPLAATAISLSEACGYQVSVDAVRDAFLAALATRYQRFRAGESPHAAWQANLEPLGRRVRVQQRDPTDLIGVATGVSPDGALFVQDDAGVQHTIWAGDITPL